MTIELENIVNNVAYCINCVHRNLIESVGVASKVTIITLPDPGTEQMSSLIL